MLEASQAETRNASCGIWLHCCHDTPASRGQLPGHGWRAHESDLSQADKSTGEAEGTINSLQTVLSEIICHKWLHSSPATPAHRRQQPEEGWWSQSLGQGKQAVHDIGKVLMQL